MKAPRLEKTRGVPRETDTKMNDRNTKKKNANSTNSTPPALPLPPPMSVAIETVGPREAEALLATNTRNRTVNAKHLDGLTASMVAGTYVPSPQSISVLADGTLGDGQHRLLAIIKSGKTYPMVVARGVPVAARDVIDTGFATRSARHALQIADSVTISTTEASALGAILWLKTSGRLDGATGAISTNDLRATRMEHGADVRAVIEVACVGGRLRHAGVVSALALARRAHPAKVDEFCVHLRDLANLEKDHPAITLRSYAFERRGAGGSGTREEVNLKTFAAFEAFREGRSLKKLYERRDVREKYLAPWRKGGAT